MGIKEVVNKVKECANKVKECAAAVMKSKGRISAGVILLILLLVLIFVFVLYFTTYKPFKPEATVVNAALRRLSIDNTTSATPVLSSSTKFHLNLRNPNRRQIRYQRLAYAVEFPGMFVTPWTDVGPMHLEGKSDVELSTAVDGTWEFTEAAADELAKAEATGTVKLSLVVSGKFRWRGWIGISRYNELSMRCDVLFSYNNGVADQVASTPCRCHVKLD